MMSVEESRIGESNGGRKAWREYRGGTDGRVEEERMVREEERMVKSERVGWSGW